MSQGQIAAVHSDFSEAGVTAAVPHGICRPGTNRTNELLGSTEPTVLPSRGLTWLAHYVRIAYAIVERPPVS